MSSYFFKVIADAFPSWYCVKTHLSAPQQLEDKPLFSRAGHAEEDQILKYNF